MSKALVIVESPAKAKTISKYLGPDFEVKASVGHIKDLPKSQLGVDIDNDFTPEYEVIDGKGKVVADLRKASKEVDVIYLAPDPDREGEAIAWHIQEEIIKSKKPIFRVMFNEITQRGVTQAIAQPQPLNLKRYESQQARRILDRLVGYQISPLLWDKVKRGLSAGRVQSVAVRLVVEREQAIRAFKPEEYWNVDAELSAALPPAFRARLSRVDGKKADVRTAVGAEDVRQGIAGQTFLVRDLQKKERKRAPAPPFTTSKLQQEASRHFGFNAKRTMQTAQRLYEGVELGDEGAVGLITYMRTDSVRLSDDAITMARAYIAEKYGPAEVPAQPNVYKTKKGAQDAHEAIRPTSMDYPPERVKAFLSPDQAKLYTLVWRRFLACQMNPAIYDATSVDITAGPRFEFRATGSVLRAAGFEAVYRELTDETNEPEGTGEGEDAGDEARRLPAMAKGDALALVRLHTEQKFTKPPPRFTDATLVKELEEKGIGRPSTYASIIQVILDKEYVEKEKAGRFKPTELGEVVTELLVQNFPEILDVEFTAEMESRLDQVEEGTFDWKKLLHQFYGPFKATLTTAKESMRDIKREEIPTDVVCEKCNQHTMVIKWGKNGRFLGCSGYPECKNTKEYRTSDEGQIEVVKDELAGVDCPTCNAPMAVRNGRFGRFLACTRYPECKTTKPLDTGVTCPKCGKGQLVEKRSKKGQTFYSCSTFPACDHALWDRPIAEPCPNCEHAFLVERLKTGRGTRGKPLGVVCPSCDWVKQAAGGGPTAEGEDEADAE
ncbi:type I DNA topoisomerase [Myxococcota bacterium]|jgi:DNA topoisomerase-1|nr:type I DNA topoisomerase [Myxococcota bacterium]